MVDINQFFRRLYILGFIVSISIGVAMAIEYNFFEQSIRSEIEDNISVRLDYMESETNAYFNRSVQAIKSVESFLHVESDEDKVLFFLKEQLENTPTYLSIYFGTPNNNMINGSGWIAPDTFDLRMRPWYIKAVEENRMVTTSVYLNASEDNWVVTFAKPIYDKNGAFIGVVGGDNSLQSILDVLKMQKISENGYVFFLDRNEQVIMHSQFEDLDDDEIHIQMITEQLVHSIHNNNEGVYRTTIDNNKGYLAWHTIDETGWIVGNFTSTSDFIDKGKQAHLILLVTLMSFLAIIMLIFLFQRKHIIKPLMDLNADIMNISVAQDVNYRLPLNKFDPFIDIRSTTNQILYRTQQYFETMNEHQEALKTANENLRSSQSALKLSEKKNRAIVNVLPDLVFINNHNGVFLDCLTNDEDQLLMKKNIFLGKTITEILPDPVAEKTMVGIQSAIKTGDLQQFEYSMDMPDGITHYEIRMIKLRSNEVLSIVRNITDQKVNRLKIEHLSYHDQLTGLYNRRFFEEELKRLDTERNLPLTIVMLDVNGLKLTNDAFGHLVGDDLLRRIGEIMKQQCRSEEILARIGGDEFVILLPQTSEVEAELIVRRIHEATENEDIDGVPISISIGWSTKTSMDQSVRETFVSAEDVMYRNKLTESQSVRNQTIQVILKTLNEKNEREKIHSDKVSLISRQIGEFMDLDHERLQEIEIAGLMHDIGKIAINENLLNKVGALSESEYDAIKKHPEIGYQILKSVDAYTSLAEYVLSHHERWDGNGYPRGLKHEEIPLISRIISIADTYEAMTSDRSYRKAMSAEMALDEIKRHAGKQFDPKLVEVFEAMNNVKVSTIDLSN